MAADTSRVRFDALRDFTGVLLQQGRVLLDADFNEWVAIVDRRLRAETVDLTSFGLQPGHAGSSFVPRQTPDGFRITSAAGDLHIGLGRMYVDGLLAENHGIPPNGSEGAGAPRFDPLLDEVVGLDEVTYLAQPHWSSPDPLPSGGPHLVYLDVWQRELTHLEAPDLVEVAIGTDTTARRQTVWRVRVLPDAGPGACQASDEDLPAAWLERIRPSGGRLSVTTAPVDPDVDPCALPPTGGYRGLENHTYRIEIHDPGPPGTATFTWSRDNGSVAVPVVEAVSPTVLRLATVGRDDVLRVSTGDWVEVLDDHRELDGRPGAMRRVTVDDAAQTISFEAALDPDLRPTDAADAAARHLRARRWDQSGRIRTAAGGTIGDLDQDGASGVITVPAMATTQVVLEHGIVASFSLADDGGIFRTGDHWIVAARSADTSVEQLEQAPPLGIHHHYARLATFTAASAPTDCRRRWPPVDTGGGDCGDCTVCVTPASHDGGSLTIQMAVDLLRESGGTVCIAAGLYDVGDGVNLDRTRSVRLRGQGLATLLVGRTNAVTATGAVGLAIERLAVLGGADDGSAALRWRNVVGGSLRETAIVALGGGRDDPDDSRDGVSGAAVQLEGVQVRIDLHDNLILGRVGLQGGDGQLGVLTADLGVIGNLIGGRTGIDLGAASAHLVCRIEGNDVMAGEGGGVLVPGAVWPTGTLAVTGNTVVTTGTGIVTSGGARIEGNVVTGVGGRRGGEGIVLVTPVLDVASAEGQVRGNRIEDRSGDGISLRTHVRSSTVADNLVRRAGSGITVAGRGLAEHLRIAANHVEEIGHPDDPGVRSHGIAVARVDTLSLVDNTVTAVGPEQVEAALRTGVFVTACRDVRVSGNVIVDVGSSDRSGGLDLGLAVLARSSACSRPTTASGGDNATRRSARRGGSRC